MKNFAFAAVLLAAASLLTTACGQGEAEAPAAPEGPEGIEAGNARLMLPAVDGNPAVLYFDVSNSTDHVTVLRAVDVAGAEGETFHQTTGEGDQAVMSELFQINLQAREGVSLEPGGMHVMVMEPGETLEAGGETEVTLTFVGGDKLSIPAEIRAAGDER